MTDPRRLLHAAAATPSRPVDIDTLMRLAGRRRRRLVTWLASLGAVIAIGAPVGVQWAAGGGHNQLRTLPVPVSTTTTITGESTATIPSVAAGPAPRSGADSRGDNPAVATTLATAGASPASASGCSVDTRGLNPGQTRSCRFTATGLGGWWAGFIGNPAAGANSPDPSAVVSVTRHGFTYHYRTSDNPGGPVMGGGYSGCNNVVIEAGDVVEVVATAGNRYDPDAVYQAGAGTGWDCNGHTS